MINKICKILVCVFTLTFIATPSSATPITDTVIVGDYEWAQVDLFVNLSWNDINFVCPDGNCGLGSLNGFDMNGWTWATASFIGENLFAEFFPPPIPNNFNYDSTYTLSAFDAFTNTTGFNPTFIGNHYQGLDGFSSDFFENQDLSFGGYVFTRKYSTYSQANGT